MGCHTLATDPVVRSWHQPSAVSWGCHSSIRHAALSPVDSKPRLPENPSPKSCNDLSLSLSAVPWRASVLTKHSQGTRPQTPVAPEECAQTVCIEAKILYPGPETLDPSAPVSGPGARCQPDPPGASLRTGTPLFQTALGRHPPLLQAGLALNSVSEHGLVTYTQPARPDVGISGQCLLAHGMVRCARSTIAALKAPCRCIVADPESVMHGAASVLCSPGSCMVLHEAPACCSSSQCHHGVSAHPWQLSPRCQSKQHATLLMIEHDLCSCCPI